MAIQGGLTHTLPETNILLMEEILHQLRLVVYPNFYRVFYPGGAGFLPSTVTPEAGWFENGWLKYSFSGQKAYFHVRS